jgi:hypothetical protein
MLQQHVTEQNRGVLKNLTTYLRRVSPAVALDEQDNFIAGSPDFPNTLSVELNQSTFS